MKVKLDNQQGFVAIDNEVIAKVAGLAAIECYGVVGMAMVSLSDGIVKLLKGSGLTKGIKVSLNGQQIELDFHIIVEYGVNIKAVTETLISTVNYKIETFSGMTVSKINVFVEGVRVDE